MLRRVLRTSACAGALFALAACADAATAPAPWVAVSERAALVRAAAGPRTHVTTSHSREPFAAVVHSCLGDVIPMTGRAHFRHSAFVTPSERVHSRVHTNLQDVGGVGLPSGLRYRLVEVAGANYNYDAEGLPPFETNHVLSYRLIGQGPRNDRYVRVRFHLTIAANGTVAVNRVETKTACEQ